MTSLIYPTTNFTRIEQLNIVRGEGIYVFDKSGRRYLEGLAGLWCSALGYGNEELIEAITGQLRQLSYSHMFGGRTHQIGIDLAERLAAMLPISDAKIFLANSGSEANDSMLKMLRYHANVTGEPRRKKIIAFERSYHGVTLASAALTGLPVNHRHFDIPVDALGILRTETPHYYHGHRDGESEAEFAERLVGDVERLILREGPETIAAFIAEPVSGAAGVVVAPDAYYPLLAGVLDEHGIPLWADEVICGFGRTGNDFGSTTVGVQPRLMSLAKQMSSAYVPISAAAIPGPMYEAMVEPSNEAGVFGHGFTYSGHPVACAAALKALEIYQRDGIFAHVASVGAYLQERLLALLEHPLVGEVRGKGLLAAAELVAEKAARKPFPDGRAGAIMVRCCEEQGLLVRAVAGNSIAFCPPLIISREQVDEMIDKFECALSVATDAIRREIPGTVQ